jgi:hypothetical protein
MFILSVLFSSGSACRCFRALDLLSSEVWVIGEAPLAAPPAGFLDDPRYAHGMKSPGYLALRKGSVFGGVLCVCGLIAGMALVGDTLAWYSQNDG